MFQRRPNRAVSRSRSLALGGVVAALAVVGGGTIAVVNAPASIDAGDILLAQNAAGKAASQTMALGTAVHLDLEPVVAKAAGGAIPAGTTVQITGLPDGLTQDGWVISGTPSRAGEYDVLVTVSNAGVSKSQKVAITVTDEADAASAPAATTESEAADSTTSDPAPSDQSAEATTADEISPELSSVPGGQSRAGLAATTDTLNGTDGLNAGAGDAGSGSSDDEPGAAGDELGDGTGGAGGDDGTVGDGNDGTSNDGDDDEVGAGTDLCAVLGDGQGGASVEKLLPALAGTEDSASTGLVMVLVNAIVGMLPSVLGEGGLLGDLGSAGQMLCTLSPALLGGQSAGADAGEAGAGVGGDAALPFSPTAVLGLLTSGAGSLGE